MVNDGRCILVRESRTEAGDNLHQFFPELFPNEIKLEVDNGLDAWRFSKYAMKRIAQVCSNGGALSVLQSPLGLTAPVLGNILAQSEFRTQTQNLMRCFVPGAVCRQAPSSSTSYSFATYAFGCQ